MPDVIGYPPLREVSLSEQVADAIRHALLNGALAPGDRIVEEQLGESLGVSRVPIREAIRQLQQQGILDVRPRRGAFVRELNARDAEDTLWVRTALHALAVEQAMATLDDAGWAGLCDRLAAALEPMRDLLANYDSRPDVGFETARLDIAWWTILIEAAGNSLLTCMWRDVAFLNRILMRHIAGIPARAGWERTIEQHRETIAILRSRALDDCKAAVALDPYRFRDRSSQK
jgi:DNA-binding GntR family transcriptional regulator